jgi:hypothetical protein
MSTDADALRSRLPLPRLRVSKKMMTSRTATMTEPKKESKREARSRTSTVRMPCRRALRVRVAVRVLPVGSVVREDVVVAAVVAAVRGAGPVDRAVRTRAAEIASPAKERSREPRMRVALLFCGAGR